MVRLAVSIVAVGLLAWPLVVATRLTDMPAIPSSAQIERTTRVAFDNNGYPPEILAQIWLDDAGEGELIRAKCTSNYCETIPMRMEKGRHQLRLRVVIDGQASPFTVATIDR